MKEELRLFIKGLINDVPPVVYIGLVAVFCFGTVFLIVFKGRKNINGLCRLLLLEYIALIYCSTVIFRKVNDVRKYEYIPFWSYDNMELLAENIMNIIVFIPLGFLFGIAVKKKKWWQVLLIGGCISSSIEFLQLLLKKGVSEFDDIMHNTLGCMIGYGIYALIKFCYDKFSSKKRAVA